MARSGNTFLRRVLELITGVYTGSDMNLNLTMHLQTGNMAGEETVSHDNIVWVTKTHWPMESPLGSVKFSAQKCISIVRNPIDILPSLALLMNLMSHSLQSQVPLNQVDPEWWDRYVKELSGVVNTNCTRMIAECEPAVPTYYVRYEDLVLNPNPVLMELFCFMLEVPSIDGTVVEKRIIDYCAKGSDAAAVYKLKAQPTRNLSRNAGMYTNEQLEYMKEHAREFLYYYGYVDHPTQADPDTTFFKYADGGRVQHDQAKLDEMFMGFKKCNAEGLKRVLKDNRNENFKFNETLDRINVPKIGNITAKITVKESQKR